MLKPRKQDRKDKPPANSQGAILKVAIQPITVSLDKRRPRGEATDTPGSLPIRYQQPM
jgi:hypothetical protein